jgi:hypothetical protein
MKIIQNHIATRQAEFSAHPFFANLDALNSVEEFLGVASDLAFWVMLFQDVLRINETRIKDSYLRKLAKHHRLEDSGHDKWFLEDVATQGNKCGINDLFDKKNTITRDAAYSIMAEVYNLHDERLRIVLLFTLESSGHIFFTKAAKFVDNNGYSDRLKYFSNTHLEVEKAHAMFEEEMERGFYSISLSVEERSAAIALVDKVYEAFNLMFDGLVEKIVQQNSLKTGTKAVTYNEAKIG